jgi:hypothetical protein
VTIGVVKNSLLTERLSKMKTFFKRFLKLAEGKGPSIINIWDLVKKIKFNKSFCYRK